ncbi:MAG: STAS domain-containing protein [Acidimicrobiia bacterium]|nr:STAS domain-containing protein [Acidimicrobiia bacterium]
MRQLAIATAVRSIDRGIVVIDVSGQLTGQADEELSTAFEAAASTTAPVVALNLTDLDYMNSSGIGVLVTLLIRAQRQKRRLAAYGLSEHYREIFRLTRLDEAFEIVDDESQLSIGGES